MDATGPGNDLRDRSRRLQYDGGRWQRHPTRAAYSSRMNEARNTYRRREMRSESAEERAEDAYEAARDRCNDFRNDDEDRCIANARATYRR